MTKNNPWKYADAGDISNNPYFKKAVQPDNKDQEKQNSNPEAANTRLVINGIYSIIEDETYAKAVHEIHDSLKNTFNESHPIFISDQNSRLYRPLSFKENIEARINDYETKYNPDQTLRSDADRKKLFLAYLDSCTGLAYQANTTKFKIDPICNTLITLDATFNKTHYPVNYSAFNGTEFDSSNKDKYNKLLSKKQFTEHEGYRFLYGDDIKLMESYWNIVQSLKPQNELMGFFTVRQNTATDELRALYVNDIDENSNASDYHLCNDARFLLVAPCAKKL